MHICFLLKVYFKDVSLTSDFFQSILIKRFPFVLLFIFYLFSTSPTFSQFTIATSLPGCLPIASQVGTSCGGGTSFFMVNASNQMQVQNIDGEFCCAAGGDFNSYFEFQILDISHFTNVSFSLGYSAQLTGSNSFEDDSPGAPIFGCTNTIVDNSHDQMVFMYSLNGGPFVQDLYVHGTTVADFTGTWSVGPVNANTLTIRVYAANKATHEIFYFQNLVVTGTPKLNAGPDDIVCYPESADLNGVWTGVWTGGSGAIANPNVPVTTYTPAASEQGTTVTLTYTGSPSYPGCPTPSDQMNVTVIEGPTVDLPPNQTVCAGNMVNVVFSGTGTSYTWTNSNTSIGLGASGTGNIGFTTANVPSVQTAVITVTPQGACPGAPMMFTITVDPAPVVNNPGTVTGCSGQTINVNFNGTPGATFNWTNDNTSIGLGANGSGNISFTSAIAGGPVQSTITITPQLGTCPGTPINFLIISNPVPVVDPVTDVTICGGQNIVAFFNSSVFGTTFTWTNNNTNTGLPASGNGNINSPSANVGVTQVSQISVTPIAGGCPGVPVIFTVTVNPSVTPVFDQIPTLCQFSVPPPLNTTSNNGISGQWAPMTISTGLPITQTYTFTPTAGQCSTPASMTITVAANVTPQFSAIPDQCQFAIPPVLQNSSVNGISGSWNPSLISTSNTGTTLYTFTPDAGICSEPVSISVNVLPNITPTLSSFGPFCASETPVSLPGIQDGISGNWSGPGVSFNQFNPSAVGGGLYTLTFNPIGGQCANTNTTSVQVIANPTGNISGSPMLCPGECGTVNFNFVGGSGTFNINMNINVIGFNFNFPMLGVTNNTTLNICYQAGFPPFNASTNTLYIPPGTPQGTATLTLLNFTSTPAGNCGAGVVGNPAFISLTILPEPTATPASITVCDEDEDGQGIFDLTSVNNTVKNFIVANTVQWFTNATATIPVSGPTAFTASGGTIVYAAVSNPQGCTKIVPVSLLLTLPVSPAPDTYSSCIDGNLITLPSMVSGFNGNWSDINGNVLANQFNPSGLPAGQYTITFTPNPGQCARTVNTIVNIITSGPVPLATPILTGCVGESILSLPASPGGVTGIWSGSTFLAGTQFNTTNSGAGTFNLTFTPSAGAGCLESNTTTILVTPNLQIPLQILDPLCQTQTPFILPATTQGYSGMWVNNLHVFNNLFTPDLVPGTNINYTLIFDPMDVCVNPIEHVITVNAPVNITPIIFSDLCLSSDPLPLPATVDGYEGIWTINSITLTSVNPTDLGEGTFSATFTPAAGQCALPFNSTININSFTAGNDSDINLCRSDATIVNLNDYLSAGAANTGLWSSSSNVLISDPENFDLDELSSGLNVVVYIISDLQCGSDSAFVSIHLFEINNAGDDGLIPLCNDNLLNVDLTQNLESATPGGIWFNTDGLITDLTNPSSVDLTSLANGSYGFTYIISAGLCASDTSLTEVLISPVNSAGPDINTAICSGSTIDLFSLLNTNFTGGVFENVGAVGGLSGSVWNTTGINAGNYSFRYIAENISPCLSDTATININLADILTAGPDFAGAICEGAETNLFTLLDNTVSQGGTFYYQGSPVSDGLFTPTSQGQYLFQYEVGDGLTCPKDTSVLTLNLVSKTLSVLSGDVDFICGTNCTVLEINHSGGVGARIYLSAASQGGTSYQWTHNSTSGSIVSLFPCGKSDSQVPNFFRLPQDESYTITIDSIILAGNGCVFTEYNSIQLEVRSIPEVNINRQLCSGGTLVVGSDVYSVSNPTGSTQVPSQSPLVSCDTIYNVALTFQNASPTTLIREITCNDNFSVSVGNVVFNKANPAGTVNLQNQFGCDSIVDVQLTFSTFSSGNFTASTCDQTQTYNIGNQVFTFINPSGTVTLQGASVAGCDSIINVSVTYLSPSTGNFNFASCDENYFVIIGNTTFNRQNPTGMATLLGMSANGCDSLVNVSLSFLPVSQNSINIQTCDDNFILDVGGTVFNKINPAGMVRLAGSALNGCDSIINVVLTFTEFDFDFSVIPICDKEESTLVIQNATHPGPFSLTISGNQSITFSSLPFSIDVASGVMLVTLSNVDNCSLTRTIVFPDNSAPDVSLSQSLLSNGNIQLNLTPGDDVLQNIIWTPAENLNCISCSDPVVSNPQDGAVYTVSYEYIIGCVDQRNIILNVEKKSEIILPNIFNPKSGGPNQYFFVVLPENMDAIVGFMRIFDRWGDMVFETKDTPANLPSAGWDGKFKGQEVVPGVYVYYIEMVVQGSTIPIILSGDVTIVR
ncbi:MAG: gliding motility-associated C-terminal domain-containing protein [Saprospiraceae bacterium]|nr:gliding motility-associated C-terminal domain-containing protein [Saprospiraceae bacterium]